ncbi:hypothetical protein SAMN04487928_10989 [Butyrivibrio proteoclasticus]|uniref:Uncharacterized protein n=1 Tax=Butyrivibrio proteoclasticus TaxID=43305 RepID=A0A1I5TN01_9FIRM|nr:hypothetical protein SAMN04487928_10989 [Butyrivibrio proteoclasticus]
MIKYKAEQSYFFDIFAIIVYVIFFIIGGKYGLQRKI